jgi:hypothetical protein
MKAKLIGTGSDGSRSYNTGDECNHDSDWLRRMLVNGLAEPMDEAALSVIRSKDQIERYRALPLIRAARAREIPDSNIPAVSGPVAAPEAPKE